jgi:hypothetical protein
LQEYAEHKAGIAAPYARFQSQRLESHVSTNVCCNCGQNALQSCAHLRRARLFERESFIGPAARPRRFQRKAFCASPASALPAILAAACRDARTPSFPLR